MKPCTVWIAVVVLAGAPSAHADVGHGHGMEESSSPEHVDQGETQPGLADAWSALMATRDAIAADVDAGRLDAVHERAERLAPLASSLLDASASLEPAKRARVEGTVRQVSKVAGALHVAADAGDATKTKRELERLDGLLRLLEAQYPHGALSTGVHSMGDYDPEGHGSGAAHAHATRPAGMVDTPAQTVLRVKALDMKFDPSVLEVHAGVPTRIELDNIGATVHSLIIRTPDDQHDWVHLHAGIGSSDSGTYKLDTPGRYPILCTIPGHTEAGMVGELVVLGGHGEAHTP